MIESGMKSSVVIFVFYFPMVTVHDLSAEAVRNPGMIGFFVVLPNYKLSLICEIL